MWAQFNNRASLYLKNPGFIPQPASLAQKGLSGISVFISHPTGNIHLAASACNGPVATVIPCLFFAIIFYKF
jgi:hypothetical protein